MNNLKRGFVMVVSALLIACWSSSCLAADNAFKDIFEDAFYGGLAGGLVGAAIMAFTKKPGDHLDMMGYGAAGGVLVGATYGLVKTTRSLVELDNGKVKLAMPTIMPDIQDTNSRGQTAVVVMAELIRGKFY